MDSLMAGGREVKDGWILRNVVVMEVLPRTCR